MPKLHPEWPTIWRAARLIKRLTGFLFDEGLFDKFVFDGLPI